LKIKKKHAVALSRNLFSFFCGKIKTLRFALVVACGNFASICCADVRRANRRLFFKRKKVAPIGIFKSPQTVGGLGGV